MLVVVRWWDRKRAQEKNRNKVEQWNEKGKAKTDKSDEEENLVVNEDKSDDYRFVYMGAYTSLHACDFSTDYYPWLDSWIAVETSSNAKYATEIGAQNTWTSLHHDVFCSYR